MDAVAVFRRFPKSRIAMAVALGLLSLPMVLSAQTTDTRHDEKTLDEIRVTASPLRGNAEQLSEPVAVLAGEKLDEARSATLGETVSGIPGVQSSNFGAGVGRPIIRGLDGPRVAVLAGGLDTQDVSTVSQDHAPVVEPFLADQIEVLKGPATLLFGSGAIGGIVNVVDGRIPEVAPTDAFSGRAEARYDSVSEGNTEVIRIDGGNERFALHADAVHRDQDNYETPDGEQANSFLETRTGAVGASLLGDWGFFGVSASRYDDNYGNPGEPGDPAEGEAGVSLDIEQDRFEARGGINAPFGNIDSLRFSVARTNYEHIEFEGDEVGTRFIKDATEGRAELTHEAMSGWTGAIGVQASKGEFEAQGEEAFVPRTESRAAGLFLVEQKKWEGFQLDLGARIDDVRRDPDGLSQRDFNPLSFSVGGIWNVATAWDLVLNIDHAERAPAEEELFANGPHIATAAFEIGDQELTEEASNQGEIGLHYHGAVVQMKASAYLNRFNDFIYLVDTGEVEDDLPVRQWTQADARFRGFEGEATFTLADNASGHWDLRAYGDTVRAKLSDGGGNVPRIAPSRLGSELRWTADQWRAAVGAIRYARQDDIAVGETETAGYTLVDAHVAYHWDQSDIGWEVFLDGRNLGDQIARVHTSFLKDAVVLPGRGFTLGIRAFF